MRSIISLLKDILQKIAELIGLIRRKDETVLLWTNPSPTSDFPAKTVNVSYEEYDYVFALGKVTTSADEGRFLTTPWVPASQGNSGFFNYIGTDYFAMSRQMTLVGGGIAFTSGYMVNMATDATYANWNNRAVPLMIFGIKLGGY